MDDNDNSILRQDNRSNNDLEKSICESFAFGYNLSSFLAQFFLTAVVRASQRVWKGIAKASPSSFHSSNCMISNVSKLRNNN